MQGRIDLVYIKDGRAVVVDYKTDRLNSTALLVSRYAGQLKVYLRAAAEILNMPYEKVSAEIYSLHLHKSIPVEYAESFTNTKMAISLNQGKRRRFWGSAYPP